MSNDSSGGVNPSDPFNIPGFNPNSLFGKNPNEFHSLPEDHGMDAFERWLGPKGYKQFKENLLNYINTQIQEMEAQEKQASQRLKESEMGDD